MTCESKNLNFNCKERNALENTDTFYTHKNVSVQNKRGSNHIGTDADFANFGVNFLYFTTRIKKKLNKKGRHSVCKHCVTFASHGSCLNPFKSTTSPTVSAVGPSSFQSSLSLSAQHKETLQIRTHTTISSPTACNPPLCAPNLFSAPYPSLLSTAKPRTTTQLQK